MTNDRRTSIANLFGALLGVAAVACVLFVLGFCSSSGGDRPAPSRDQDAASSSPSASDRDAARVEASEPFRPASAKSTLPASVELPARRLELAATRSTATGTPRSAIPAGSRTLLRC